MRSANVMRAAEHENKASPHIFVMRELKSRMIDACLGRICCINITLQIAFNPSCLTVRSSRKHHDE
jgi:hypothetical protein